MNICKWRDWKEMLKEEFVRSIVQMILVQMIFVIPFIIFGIENPSEFVIKKIKQLKDKIEIYSSNAENSRKGISPSLFDERIEFYRRLADRQYNVENYEDALDTYRDIVKISPQDVAAKRKINQIMTILKSRR